MCPFHSDYRREVGKKEAAQFAKERGMVYMELTAKDFKEVEEVSCSREELEDYY